MLGEKNPPAKDGSRFGELVLAGVFFLLIARWKHTARRA